MSSVEVKNFQDLKLNKWLEDQCRTIGVKKPTPIQENCIPEILSGKDCIGCAKTGSGKTLAFALPIIQKFCEDPYGIFSLILTPTRELAFQIGEQFEVLGKPINLRKCVIVGGIDMIFQGLQLSKYPHIVIATPGRLADHLESCNTFSLNKIKFLVLDEADRLLAGHFDEQLETIFKVLPKKRQNLLFSATMTDTLEKVKEFTSNEVFVFDQQDDTGIATVKELKQYYVPCSVTVRDAYLVEVIRTYRETSENSSIMIFTDTCRDCQLISMTLNEVGFENVALHAMMKQRERLEALHKFKANQVKILIATEVAARGLDIPSVQLVVNHKIPNIPKEYIHRVGRTARAGRAGMAVSLITPHDLKLLQAIEATIGMKLIEFNVDDREIVSIFTEVSVTKREAEMKLDESDFMEKKFINKKKKLILNGMDPDEAEEFIRQTFILKKSSRVQENSETEKIPVEENELMKLNKVCRSDKERNKWKVDDLSLEEESINFESAENIGALLDNKKFDGIGRKLKYKKNDSTVNSIRKKAKVKLKRNRKNK